MGEVCCHLSPICSDPHVRRRSVHNSRIERLWYDVTEGFGRKWKDFFYNLEDHHHLDVSNPTHIWLLHVLFLPAINADALAWAEGWNSHKIQLDGERRRSPRQLFAQSALVDGIRGLPPPDSAIDHDPCGISWEAVDGLRHTVGQDEIIDAENDIGPPNSNNNVICDPPKCPLTDEQLHTLHTELTAWIGMGQTDMNCRRVIWIRALELLAQVMGESTD